MILNSDNSSYTAVSNIELSERTIKQLVDLVTKYACNPKFTKRIFLDNSGINMLFDKKRIEVSSHDMTQSNFFVMVYPYKITYGRKYLKIADSTGLWLQLTMPEYMNTDYMDDYLGVYKQ